MTVAPCPKEYLGFASALADAVGEVHRRHFRRPLAVDAKADGSVVTRVDRESEALVRDRIAARYPGHGVIGEEYGADRPEAEQVWIVDPLDGTRLYLLGIPQFAVLIALAVAGRFVLGVIDQPVVRDRWLGADGHGTALNGRPVRTRSCRRLADAVLCRPGVGDHTGGRDAAIDRVAAGSRWVHWGVTPCDYGLLAAGFIDLVVTAGPKLHDYAAVEPVVRNAGGAVTDWDGEPLGLRSKEVVAAAGDPALAAVLRARLRAAPR